MDKVETVLSSFRDGFSCAQALLSAYGPELGLDRETALKVAGAFGGGMGRMGEACGAVTGAIMVIGLKYGSTDPKDFRAKEEAYRVVRVFAERFRALNESITCKELLGCDIGTPEGMKLARKSKVFSTRCPKYVKDAAEIIEELLR